MSHGRNIYARVQQEPDGRIQIAVADIGDGELVDDARQADCRVRV